jgi:hypothetical protein
MSRLCWILFMLLTRLSNLLFLRIKSGLLPRYPLYHRYSYSYSFYNSQKAMLMFSDIYNLLQPQSFPVQCITTTRHWNHDSPSISCYFPRCLLFQTQNRRTGSCARSLSTVFNSIARVLLSYMVCIALWHDRQIEAPRVDISARVKICFFNSARWVDRGIKWWNVSGIYRSHSYITS